MNDVGKYPNFAPPLPILPTITANMSQKDFVNAVYARGKIDEAKTKIPAAIFTAQACLESGYGTSPAATNKNNLFGFMVNGKIRNYNRHKWLPPYGGVHPMIVSLKLEPMEQLQPKDMAAP